MKIIAFVLLQIFDKPYIRKNFNTIKMLYTHHRTQQSELVLFSCYLRCFTVTKNVFHNKSSESEKNIILKDPRLFAEKKNTFSKVTTLELFSPFAWYTCFYQRTIFLFKIFSLQRRLYCIVNVTSFLRLSYTVSSSSHVMQAIRPSIIK